MPNSKSHIQSGNKKIEYIGYWILVVLLALIAFPKHVFAENIALGIYPPIIQIQAKAPANIQSPLTISNESNTPVDVSIGVRPFTQGAGEDGIPQFLGPGQPIGTDAHIFEKMSLFDGTKNTNEILLAPLQKKNITLLIHLPSGEPPGDYYFSITFISKPIPTDHQTGTAVAGGISTNVLLSIGPYDKTTGYIKDYSSAFFLTSGPVPFRVSVANTSKHFISPQGTILIQNMFGQTIGKVTLQQDNILAGTTRFLTDNTVGKHLPTGHPQAVWDEKFLLGPYAATLTIALSPEGPLYRRTIYFFALPIQLLVGIILAIVLIGIVVYRVRKRLL